MARSGAGVLGFLAVGLGVLGACEPLHDRCVQTSTGEPVGFEEVGAPGFAAADVLLPEGTYAVHDGGLDLVVTLAWAATARPRTFVAEDGDRDGKVDPASCPSDYVVRGTLTLDSGDGRYDEVGSADAVASAQGATRLWVVIDAAQVRGDDVPGEELWLEVWEDADGPWFGLSAVGLGGDAELLVTAPLEPVADAAG